MARHAAQSSGRGRLATIALTTAVAVLVAAVIAGALVIVFHHRTNTNSAGGSSQHHASGQTTSTTTSTTPPTTTTTALALPPPGPGFNAGHVTAVGDSVMIDYQDPLEKDIPGVNVQASVSRQWGAGESLLEQLKASGQLGAEVIVGLSTNGPIAASDFDDMMGILQGASRVVFVNVHVDRPWQDPNNAVLAAGAARYKNVVIADWATLAAQNPQWFGSDGTHLAIDGTGADALASLITSTLSG